MMRAYFFFRSDSTYREKERANPSLALFGGCQVRIVCIDGQTMYVACGGTMYIQLFL